MAHLNTAPDTASEPAFVYQKGDDAKRARLRRASEAAQPQPDTPWPGATALFYGQAKSYGNGPWLGEPDHVRWVEPTSGLHCIARRGYSGGWCGYVAVEHGHPMHGKSYDEAHKAMPDLEVYGGLTFAESCEESDDKTAICHDHDGDHPAWWFGFDCFHCDDFIWFHKLEFLDDSEDSPEKTNTQRRLFSDNPEDVRQEAWQTYKTLKWVRLETEQLAQQLKMGASHG